MSGGNLVFKVIQNSMFLYAKINNFGKGDWG